MLGANLDRYSSDAGLSAGEDGTGPEGRTREQDHVMSFMSFGNTDNGATGGGNGHGGGAERGDDEDGVVRRARGLSVLVEECGSPGNDVPPAYESGDYTSREEKSPSATMGWVE